MAHKPSPALALVVAVVLAGCAFVRVEGDAALSFWPLGVRVSPIPGAPEALRVRAETLGLAAMGCGVGIGVGFSSFDCIQMDPRICGAAIYEDGPARDLLVEIGKHTLAVCREN